MPANPPKRSISLLPEAVPPGYVPPPPPGYIPPPPPGYVPTESHQQPVEINAAGEITRTMDEVPTSLGQDIAHLLSSIANFGSNLSYLKGRVKSTAWLLCCYAVVAYVLPLQLFIGQYDIESNRILTGALTLLFGVVTASLAFLAFSLSSKRNGGKMGREGVIASLCLLMVAATEYGTNFAFLHGMFQQESPVIKLMLWAFTMLLNILWGASSCQMARYFMRTAMKCTKCRTVTLWVSWQFFNWLIFLSIVIFHLRVL